MTRSLCSAALLALFALLATARAEVLSYSFTSLAVPTAPTPLSGLSSVAVWGTNPAFEPVYAASYFAGEQIYSYATPLSALPPIQDGVDDPKWLYDTGDGLISGALAFSPMGGEPHGFRLMFFPDAVAATNVQVFLQTYGPSAITIQDTGAETTYTTTSDGYGVFGLTMPASESPVVLDVVAAGEAPVILGHAAVVAVPEPGMFIAISFLVVFVAVWYRLAIWIDQRIR